LSEANVKTVRRSLEAFARGELDVFLEASDPDIEWTTAADEPNPRTYRGRDDMRRFAADIAEAWTDRFDDVMEFEAFIDLGDWVVVPWTARTHGRVSGITVHMTETYAVRVEGGRIVRVDEYRTTDEAIESVRSR
jgi:ketosteroid isomerase-like protein